MQSFVSRTLQGKQPRQLVWRPFDEHVAVRSAAESPFDRLAILAERAPFDCCALKVRT